MRDLMPYKHVIALAPAAAAALTSLDLKFMNPTPYEQGTALAAAAAAARQDCHRAPVHRLQVQLRGAKSAAAWSRVSDNEACQAQHMLPCLHDTVQNAATCEHFMCYKHCLCKPTGTCCHSLLQDRQALAVFVCCDMIIYTLYIARFVP